MTHYSNDYDKVGTKSNARAWERIRKNAIEEREARERNPRLAEQYDEIGAEIVQRRQIAADSWGYFYSMDSAPEAMREYYARYVDPLRENEAEIRKMLYCKHKRIDIGEECLSCRDCGAVDYGRGFLFHESMIASKTDLA